MPPLGFEPATPASQQPQTPPMGLAPRHTTIFISVLLLRHVILSYSYFSPLYFVFSSSSSSSFSPPLRSLFLPPIQGWPDIKMSRCRHQPFCNVITYFLLYVTASCFCSSIILWLQAAVSLPSLDSLLKRHSDQAREHINYLQIICLEPNCSNRTVATPEAVYSLRHYRLSQRC